MVDPELVETFLFQNGICSAQIKAQLTAFSYKKASVSTDQFEFPFLVAQRIGKIFLRGSKGLNSDSRAESDTKGISLHLYYRLS